MRRYFDFLAASLRVTLVLCAVGCGEAPSNRAPDAPKQPVQAGAEGTAAPPTLRPTQGGELAPENPQSKSLLLSPDAELAVDRLLERGMLASFRPAILGLLHRVDVNDQVHLVHTAEALFTTRSYASVTPTVRVASLQALTVLPRHAWEELAETLQDVVPRWSEATQSNLITAALAAPTDKVANHLRVLDDLLNALHGPGSEGALARVLAAVPGERDAQFVVANQLLWLCEESESDWQALATQLAHLTLGAAEDSKLSQYFSALLAIKPNKRTAAARGLAGITVSRRADEAEGRLNFLLERPPHEFAIMASAVGHFFDVPNRPSVLNDILRLHEGLWSSFLFALSQSDADEESLAILAGEAPDEQSAILSLGLRILSEEGRARYTGDVMRRAVLQKRTQ